ncbi:MAG: DUF2179 domain-containing protein [Prevotellaceae bacterium]|nr:DUF2179 domain-containing protein [Prevotellaceae bacterium]
MTPSFAFVYVALPIIIFCSRILDVTLGTMRIIFVSKGHKRVAPLLGFFEVFVWILVISQIMQHANNIYCYVAYAAGFAMGNFVGMMIEERIAIGIYFVRVITPKNGDDLVAHLNEKGYGATLINGKGKVGQVNLIYSVVSRKSIGKVEQIITDFDPNVFYVIEDVRTAKRGIFPDTRAHLNMFGRHKQEK